MSAKPAVPSPRAIVRVLRLEFAGYRRGLVLTGVLIGAVASGLVGVVLLKAFPVAEIGEQEEEEEQLASVPGLA